MSTMFEMRDKDDKKIAKSIIEGLIKKTEEEKLVWGVRIKSYGYNRETDREITEWIYETNYREIIIKISELSEFNETWDGSIYTPHLLRLLSGRKTFSHEEGHYTKEDWERLKTTINDHPNLFPIPETDLLYQTLEKRVKDWERRYSKAECDYATMTDV